LAAARDPNTRKQWFGAVLGWSAVLAGLLGVVYWIGPARLFTPWLRIAPWSLLIALLLMLASYGLRALRIQRYFNVALRGQFWATLKLSVWHNLSNNLLPMRAGEVAFPILMQRYFDLPAHRTVPVLLWFRLLDLQAIVVLGLASALWSTGLSRDWLWPVLVLLPAPFVVYALRFRMIAWLGGMPDDVSDSKGVRGKLLAALASLPEAPAHFASTLLWTWVNWLAKLAALAWLLVALADVKPAVAVLGAIGGDLTTILPIHAPGGFGTFEAGVLAAIKPFGVPAQTAVAAAVNLHLFLLGASLLSVLLTLWIRSPVPGRRTE